MAVEGRPPGPDARSVTTCDAPSLAVQSMEVTRVTKTRSNWFSENPDKAWGEKFFLSFIPAFFAYNALMQGMGWLDTTTFWHVVQNVVMWVPYCLLLPAWLRRDSAVPWHASYWWKFNVYMFVFVFWVTYFHTEYFFDLLGLRYRHDAVHLYFDSSLVGPNEATAAATYQKVPVGMYLNAVAFFVVYHTAAVVCMRRVRSVAAGLSAVGQRIAWVVIVLVSALFWAWAETRLYITQAASTTVWYEDLDAMLVYGSIVYSMYFVASFPSVFRLDETRIEAPWSMSRIVIEATAAALFSMFLFDLWGHFVGRIY